MVVCRYGISLFVFNLISHSLAALTREILLVKYQALYLRALMYYPLSQILLFLGQRLMDVTQLALIWVGW